MSNHTKNFNLFFSLTISSLLYTLNASAITMLAAAKNNSPILKQMALQKDIALEQMKMAKSDMLPSLSTSFSYNYNDMNNPEMMQGSSSSSLGQFSTSISMPIFTGFAASTRYKMATIGIESRRLSQEQSLVDLVAQVKKIYLSALTIKRSLMAAELAVTNLEAHLLDAKKLYADGMISKDDVLKSEVGLANSKQSSRIIKTEMKSIVASLNILMGQPITSEIEFDDASDSVDWTEKNQGVYKSEIVDLDVDDLIMSAEMRRAEIKLMEKSVAKSDLAIKLAESGYYPTVSLTANHNESYNFPDHSRSEFIGVMVNWKIFDWGKTRSQVRSSKLEKEIILSQYKNIIDNIRLEVHNAYIEALLAYENIDAAKVTLAQSKESWSLTNELYKQGRTTSTEVLQAQSSYTQAESSYYATYFGYKIAMTSLNRAIGKKE